MPSIILNEFGRPMERPPSRGMPARNGASSNGQMRASLPTGPGIGFPLGHYTYYEGAFPGRQRGQGNYLHLPQDFSVEGDLERQYLAFYARQLSRNCGEVDGIIGKIITYVVGREMTPMSLSENGKEVYEDYWNSWKDKVTPDGASIGEVQSLCLKKCILDGDVGIWRFLGENRMPQLQLISSQKIGNTHVKMDKRHRIQGGVEYRLSDGAVVRYWLNRAQPQIGNNSVEDNRKPIGVTSKRFSLMYSRPDTGAYRGISHLAPVINDGLDITNVMDALKIGMVQREMLSLVVQRQGGAFYQHELVPPLEGEEMERGTEEGNTTISRAQLPPDDPRYMILGPGTITVSKEGEDWKDLSSNRPRAEVLAAIEKMVRRVCQALKVPYEFAVDPGQIKGTGTRAILRDSEETFKYYAHLLDRHLNLKMWNAVIWHGIINKELPLEPDWDCVNFSSPVAPSVDVAKDVKAELEELAAGTKTLQEIYHAKGKHWLDGIKQRAAEEDVLLDLANKLAKKHDFPVDKIRNVLSSIGELESEDTMKQEEKGQMQNSGGEKKSE